MWGRYKDKGKYKTSRVLSVHKSNDTKACVRNIIATCNLYACNKDRILDNQENEIDAKKCYEAFSHCKSVKSIRFLLKDPKKQDDGFTLSSTVDLSSDFHFHIETNQVKYCFPRSGIELGNQSQRISKKFTTHAKHFWYWKTQK